MPWSAPTDAQLRHSRRATDQRYNQERAAKRGPDPRSTARWRRVRAMKLAQQPLCETCEAAGKTVAATEVDHVQGIWERPDLVYTMENLTSYCVPCHARKSAAERQAH